MITITDQMARRLAVTKQLLTDPRPPATAAGIMQLFAALGCVQIDPIRAVERTQLLVLWSRLGAFDPALLDRLQWEEKQLLEDWAHAASIVRLADYPLFHTLQMHRRQKRNDWWHEFHRWAESNQALLDHMREKLQGSQPLAPQDFDDSLAVNPWRSTGWSNGRSVTRILDLLFGNGEIVVAGRTANAKLWQRTEEWLPEWAEQQELSDTELTRRALPVSLKALGVATANHIYNHFLRKRYPKFKTVLAELQAQGEIVPIQVADKIGEWYLHRDDLPLLESLAGDGWRPRTLFLSPFDNLICDRDRTELLFDFFYRIEIYVPVAKRQYGYYVMPILHGDRLIGRMDSKLDRKSGIYTVNALHTESDAYETAEIGAAVADSLADLVRFIGAQSVVYGDQIPAVWRDQLTRDPGLAAFA